jgi:hypothetical protein
MKTNRILTAAGIGLLLAFGAVAQSIPAPSQTTLLIRTDENAIVSVDGKSVGMVQAYSPLETPVTPGSHLVSATAVAGSGRSDQSVQVGSGQRAIVLVELLKAGLQQQQQTLDQQQKAQQAQQKQQCRDQLQAKRAEYNTAVQKYTWELQQAQESAQMAQLSGNSSQGGPQWLQGINGVLNGVQKAQATQHQTNAALLKVQVDQLRQEVSDLQRCAGTQ